MRSDPQPHSLPIRYAPIPGSTVHALSLADHNVRTIHFVHLDMLRGLAALGVLLGHVRGFVVVNYGVGPTDERFAQLFYFMTGLGHQCVIAFFALSGFLVGGPVLRDIRNGRWTWQNYMLRRATRLWTVLIPALLLTLFLDTAGIISGGGAGYDGAYYSLVVSGPQVSMPADLSPQTFLANLFFLQTIVAPVYGSNGPLWSLANEFWYYIVFPMIFLAVFGAGRAAHRSIIGLLGLMLVMLLPKEIGLLGIIWGLGAIGHQVARLSSINMVARRVWIVSSPLVLLFLLVVSKLHPGLASDLLLGAAFASMLPALTWLPSCGRLYGCFADASSKISYTLYATHFPVLAFIWFVLLAPTKWPLGVPAIAVMTSLVTTALMISAMLWWLFERNTDRVRGVLEKCLFTEAAGHAKLRNP
jgi:peptidoglycan/LPS O-acetylase OafA/YrhL